MVVDNFKNLQQLRDFSLPQIVQDQGKIEEQKKTENDLNVSEEQ